jgi:secreted PhoX family phosphatase
VTASRRSFSGSGACDSPTSLSRRSFLRHGAQGAGLLGLGILGGGAAPARAQVCDADQFGPLLPANAHGLMLPAGFTSRVVATSNQVVPGTAYVWPPDPDGGATFATQDGGWIYVANAERFAPNGGVSAIRFDAGRNVMAAYSILTGTARNCAGGPTPWGTWLSCEEVALGRVFECDPFTPGSQGVARFALGRFNHEAAAVMGPRLYLTEDMPDGLFYRFTPDSFPGGVPSLASGRLEAAQILDPGGDGPIAPGEVRPLAWHTVPDPLVWLGVPTRDQVAAATLFNGGEGCWSDPVAGRVYFTTKGNDRVWVIDVVADTIEILYDRATSSDPQLAGVDNVTVSACGDVYVAEDPGNLQIVALTASGGVRPIVQVANAPGSEITGPAFSPDGTRLYFSSQRNPGRTFEVTGPFAPLPVPGLPPAWGAVLGAAVGVVGALAAWRARAGDRTGT